MKKLLLLLVGVLSAFIAQAATDYVVGNTYYIDISQAISGGKGMFDDGQGIYVNDGHNKGGQLKKAIKVTETIYKWKQETANAQEIRIARTTDWESTSSNYDWYVQRDDNKPNANLIIIRDSGQKEWSTTIYTETGEGPGEGDGDGDTTDWSKIELYLRGFGSWGSADQTKKFTYSNGVYTLPNISITKNQTFKIGSGEDQNWAKAFGPDDVALTATDIEKDGTDNNFKATANLSNVTFTFTPDATPKPTLVVTAGATGTVVKLWTNFYKTNKNDFEGYDFNSDKEYQLTFAGNETNTKVGLHVDDAWRGADAANLTYDGSSIVTYNMTQTSNGDILFASGLKGVVTFKLIANGNSYSLQVSGGSTENSGNEEGEADKFVSGNTYYIDFSKCQGWIFDQVSGKYPIFKVKSGNDYATCTIVNATAKLVKFVAPATCSSLTFQRCNPNNASEVYNWMVFAAPANAAHNYFTVTSFKDKDNAGSTGTWKTFANDVEEETNNDLEDNGSHTSYWLSGDVNCWSDKTSRNTANNDGGNKHKGYFTGESSYLYVQDDADNPFLRFQSKDDMDKYWKFKWVGNGPEGETGNDWYRLDMWERESADMDGHRGRLCGQFKIIQANLEKSADPDENLHGVGITVNNNNLNEYWNKNLKIGETRNGDWGGGQNFILYNTAIEHASIWFHPAGAKVRVTGQPHDMYVYYVGPSTRATAPETYLQVSGQENNKPQTDPFKNGTSNDGNDFKWEKVASAIYYPQGNHKGTPIEIKSDETQQIWRKLIPGTLIHRTPMGFLTSVTNSQGKYFPRVRIDCDDIWFFENDINVYFRFEDKGVNENENTHVYFNAWMDQFDGDGNMVDPVYLQSAWARMEVVKPGTEGYNAIDEKHREGNRWWYKAPANLITSDFANAGHALFSTNYGGAYPAGGVKNSSVADRAAVAMNGVDLYYVVGGSSNRIGLLYSHLKNTVALSDITSGKVTSIQVNAEFFAQDHPIFKDGDLNTFYGAEVDYSFTISDSEGNVLQKSLNSENNTEWIDEPYIDWTLDKTTVSDLYQIKVRVRKMKADGSYEYYNASDVYPIFERH